MELSQQVIKDNCVIRWIIVIRIGQKINSLTFAWNTANTKSNARTWLFTCECGNSKVMKIYNVLNWLSKSCGCLQVRKSIDSNKKVIEYTVNENWCHICTSHFLIRWYPRITIKGKNKQMSRHIWEINKWPIPRGMLVRHKCDQPTCINIEHLELWTHTDNMQDRVHRFTWARWEKAFKAKLSEEQARSILNSQEVISTLAKQYGVNESSIRKIKNRKSRRHLT